MDIDAKKSMKERKTPAERSEVSMKVLIADTCVK
jgi:hypothetical protein